MSSPILPLAVAAVFAPLAHTQFQEQQKLEPLPLGSPFASTVTCHLDTVVCGAPTDSEVAPKAGAVYIYVADGIEWFEQAKLTASDATTDDLFGTSLAISGDTLVVGKPRDDDNGENSGAAYVFVRNGTVWTEQAKLTANDGQSFDGFGGSVTIDRDTVVVGATSAFGAAHMSGAAYVYTRSGSTWSFQQKLTASDGAQSDAFGYVALHRGTLAIGAPLDDDGGSNTGSAYVFVRSAGAWIEQAKLVASDGQAGDLLARAIDVHGDTVVVGSHDHAGVGAESGAAYVFVREAGVWNEKRKLTAGDAAVGDEYATDVAVDGETLAIGAPQVVIDNKVLGASYVYTRSGTVWGGEQKLVTHELGLGGRLGFAVALHAATFVAADPGDPFGGAAHVFTTDTEPGDSSCFGTGCPCHDDPTAGCQNSTGRGALLTGIGTTSVSADDLILRTYRLRPNELALFFMGGTQAPVPFFDGLLCTSAPFVRFGTQIQLSDNDGTVVLRDVVASSGGAITAGSTWQFQTWYRDSAPCGHGSNVSSAYSITFEP